MKHHAPSLMASLEVRGYKSTIARKAIVNFLKHKQGGFTVREISEELPWVGRATVYRTIKLFLESGAVCRLSTVDGSPKYSVSRIDHHHHTVCIRCGAVGEFRAPAADRMLRAIGDDIPGQLVGHRIEFYVTCDYCGADGGK